MVFPSFSTKQRIALWIAVCAVAVWFDRPPYRFIHVPRGGGTWAYPDPRSVLFFFAIVGLSSGIAALFSNRRPLILFGLVMLAIIAALVSAGLVFDAVHPVLRGPFKKGDEERHAEAVRRHAPYANCGFALGAAAVPLVAALSAALRKRSDPATSP